MSQLSEKVLALLEERRGQHISGERIAEELSVSRAAVWKAIDLLRKSGHEIEAVNHRGYRLKSESDLLTEYGIYAALEQRWRDIPVTVYPVIDSTNRAAKAAASEGAPHGSVILSEEQTAGRGRRGRSFYSPAKTGIYMSVVLRPQEMGMDAQRITMAAAVAVCRALQSTLHISAQIKWVNDIFWNGRKVCGILSEAVLDLESRQVESVVVGIGLNVRTKDFPEELSGIAGSLESDATVPRVTIAAAILNELLSIVESGDDILDEYAGRVFIIGKKIAYMEQGKKKEATALRIAPDGALVVLNKNDGEKHLYSADISIVPLQN